MLALARFSVKSTQVQSKLVSNVILQRAATDAAALAWIAIVATSAAIGSIELECRVRTQGVAPAFFCLKVLV